MRAMVLDEPGRALRAVERPTPAPGPGQLLLRARACAVCRTDLHVVAGELPATRRALVPAALRAVEKGGVVVCAGIHRSDIPAFPYALRWGERQVRSVANLTRRDGEEFLALAPRVPVRTVVRTYPLAQANAALDDLRAGRVVGAAVLVTEDGA